MFVDLLGKTRIKLAVHTSPRAGESVNDCALHYLDHGFDAIALTENWKFSKDGEKEGLKVISGCEYSVGELEDGGEVYHIVGIGMTSDPEVPTAWSSMKKTSRAKAAEIVNMIQKRNGVALLAYPSHNKNRAEELIDIGKIDLIEIFNSEIGYGSVTDGYAGAEIDRMSMLGISPAIVASNGNECYEDEEYICSIMVEATDMDTSHIIRAIRQGRFYATEGPEIHIERIGADKLRVICSPACEIRFFTDAQTDGVRTVTGDDLLEADYVIRDGERAVRAEITDVNGLRAWTNTVRFDELYR